MAEKGCELNKIGWLRNGTDSALRFTMRKFIATELGSVFPHEKDEAFLIVVKLQTSVAHIPFHRGTGVLRSKLQRAIVRLADCLIEVASGPAGSRREHLDELAILSCRKAAGFLRLLKAAAVLNEQQHADCRSLLVQITQLLIQRMREWRLNNSIIGQTLDSRADHKNGRDVHSLQSAPGMLLDMKKPPSRS